MQSIWAKARRAQHNGRRTYSTIVAGAGRRVTGAPRRKATFTEIFTACYSSVFASASIIDAVVKEERRQELDRQVEEARRELDNLRGQDGAQGAIVEASITQLTDGQMQELWRSLKLIYTTRPYLKEVRHPATLTESVLRERLQRDHYNCTEMTLDKFLRYRVVEELDRATILEESTEHISRRDPLSMDHLRHFSDSIETLVRRLLSRAKNSRHADSKPSTSYNEALRLLDAGYPYYQLRGIDPETARKNTIYLNNANKAAIRHTGLDIKEKIGRVCYNLLISAYPPDMHTFNTLMVAFDSKYGYGAFSEAVVNTFFYNSVLKPTPSTYAAILYHYNMTRNHGMFLRTLACIVGLDDKTGAKVKSVHVDRAVMDPFYRRWARNTRDRTITGDFIYQHLPLNRLVVEEILRGLLRFHMIEAAVSFLTSCIHTGVGLSTRTIKQVLDGCLMTLDWTAGVRLIRELTQSGKMWNAMMEQCDDKTKAYVIDRIYSVLDMIGLGESNKSPSEKRLDNLNITNENLSEFRDEVQQTNVSLPHSMVVQSLRGDSQLDDGPRSSRSRMLQIESLHKEYIRLRKTTVSIESKFLKYPLTLNTRVSMANQVGEDALERSHQLCQDIEDVLADRKLGRRVRPREVPLVISSQSKNTPSFEYAAQAPMPLLASLAANTSAFGGDVTMHARSRSEVEWKQ